MKTTGPTGFLIAMIFLLAAAMGCGSARYKLNGRGMRASLPLRDIVIQSVNGPPDSLPLYPIHNLPDRLLGPDRVVVRVQKGQEAGKFLPFFEAIPGYDISVQSDLENERPVSTISEGFRKETGYVIHRLTRFDRPPQDIYFYVDGRGQVTEVVELP